MNQLTEKRMIDVLPPQEHYYLLDNGKQFARHGTRDSNGLLVFCLREKAEVFCMTVAKGTGFVPLKVTGKRFLELGREAGAFCLADGLSVRVCRIEQQS